jgi:Pyruvate/2-oxoacid:ferredoxin oxidoreductase gamma subunit
VSGPTADPNFSWPVSRAEFETAIKSLWTYVRAQKVRTDKLGAKEMALQDDLNAIAAGIQSDVTAIQAEIAALEAQIAAGVPADLTALKAAVASLDAVAAPVAPPAV